MQKLKRICVLLISAILILGCSFSSYANIDRLMFATDSNAVSTFAMSRSSIGTVVNTISGSKNLVMGFHAVNGSSSYTNYVSCTFDGSRFSFKAPAPLSGYYYDRFNINLDGSNLPSPGGYSVSLDLASDFSIDYGDFWLWSRKDSKNAESLNSSLRIQYQQQSGDLYVAPFDIQMTNVQTVGFIMWMHENYRAYNLAGDFAICFVPKNVSSSAPSMAGTDTSYEDYQSGMSSSISDLSSSVGSMSDEIGSVAEAIEGLQGAMEPHYNNVLTQLHHVTEQLHALWDQQYNLHHVPLLAKLSDIITAIETMDVNITVDVDGLKSTINTMSTNIQNKLGSVQTALTNKLTSVQTGINNKLQSVQDSLNSKLGAVQTAINDKLTSVQNGINNKLQNVQDGINTKLQNVTDHITGGYDNSGITQENEKLEESINQYDEVESGIFEDAEGFIGDFEYPSVDSLSLGIIKALAFVGSFLQGIFICMSDFNVIITFSLTMIFVMVVVGYHRIRS